MDVVTGKLRTLAPATYNFLSGIIILLFVVFLWTASNFVTQDLYDDGYEKPFLVTYLCTSSFALYLLPFYVYRQWKWVQKISFARPRGLRAEREYQPLRTDPDISEEPTVSSAPTPGTGALKEASPPLTTRQTANLALTFCFVWFIANWSLNASLNYTTAASAMILSSTSGFFTLGIGRLFRVETLTRIKTLAVVTSFLGVVLVYISDSRQGHPVIGVTTTKPYQRVLGDSLGLVSAIFYSFYVLLLKVRIGSESRIDMQLFFGFVGLFNILLAWPIGLLLHFTGAEVFEWPRSKNVVVAILINMGITLFSDYLYVIAMLKTTPVVVTVGLSLTIPFTVIGDTMLGHSIHTQVILGALLVMGSFVAVGLDSTSDSVA